MDELTAFIAARLDERETAVRDHLCVHCGNPTVPLRSALGITGYTHGGESHPGRWQGVRCPGRFTGAEPVQDPVGVLREVAAKRAVLAAHAGEINKYGEPEPRCLVCLTDRGRYQEDWSGDPWPCLTVRHLAAVYSDHPDYRPEWSA